MMFSNDPKMVTASPVAAVCRPTDASAVARGPGPGSRPPGPKRTPVGARGDGKNFVPRPAGADHSAPAANSQRIGAGLTVDAIAGAAGHAQRIVAVAAQGIEIRAT